MSEQLTHWKKLTDPNYIGAHDFQPDQELTLTIEKVEDKIIELYNGRELEKKHCTLLTFKESKTKKPLILNKVNAKIISKNLDTPYVEKWIGKQINLYVAKIRAFGEMTEAVRVKQAK